MPRHPDTITSPNPEFAALRRALPSPQREGQYMSRAELADAVNRALQELYPERGLKELKVTDRWIGQVERGESRWPAAERRAALHRVFAVNEDAKLGLYNPRRTGELVDDTSASAPAA